MGKLQAVQHCQSYLLTVTFSHGLTVNADHGIKQGTIGLLPAVVLAEWETFWTGGIDHSKLKRMISTSDKSGARLLQGFMHASKVELTCLAGRTEMTTHISHSPLSTFTRQIYQSQLYNIAKQPAWW